MSFVNLIGIASNDPIPGTYVQVDFAAGESSGSGLVYTAIILANSLATGAAGLDGYVYGPDTQVPLITEGDAINLFGAGSEAHRMWKRFTAVNKTTPLYVCTVAEASGSQATGSIVLANNATSAGTVRVWLDANDFVDVGFASGDTPTVIGDAVEDAINAKTSWPFTASNSSGTITLTSKQKGAKYNFIKYSAQIMPATGVGTTVTPVARTKMTGGSGTDNVSNALAAISAHRYYYYVTGDVDSTNLGKISAQIDQMALPAVGMRQRFVWGSSDTLANSITLATGINQARAESPLLPGSDWIASDLAANAAGVYTLMETALGAQFTLNFDNFGSDANTSGLWLVPAPMDGSAMSRTEQSSAILSGLSPIVVTRPGVTSLLTRVTNYTLNGTTPDYRVRDACIVTVCDYYGDDVKAVCVNQFGGRTIGNDPAPGQTIPNPNVVTPKVLKASIDKVTTQYTNDGLLDNPFLPNQNIGTIQSKTLVVREANPDTALSARIPLAVIRLLHRIQILIEQV